MITASPVAFFMYLCYIDESGTPDIPGNTSHYILAGLSIPISDWKEFDGKIQIVKNEFGLDDSEIHTAWILRKYIEQNKIPNFDKLPRDVRIYEVQKIRKTVLFGLQKSGGSKYRQQKKNFKETENYIHLTFLERKEFILRIARIVSGWSTARLFAECIDKISYDPKRSTNSISEQALEQIVSRFEAFLSFRSQTEKNLFGMLIHDNNQTVAQRHTNLMKQFHKTGTLWLKIPHIIETPLFVDSKLTSMVQLADLCAYSIRRYLENNEDTLFELIIQRADTKNNKRVGVRHFPGSGCDCKICRNH
jgi:hypothetical protein